jgi:O-antigen/teichoic acid export membrane protein
MALIDIKDMPRWSPLARVFGRARGWLCGEHSLTQRMAGAAFAIRSVSAGIIFLSQVLLARWMGSGEFGTYVYVYTWLILVGELIHLGLPLTAQRFIPEYQQECSSDLLRGYLSGSRWLTLAIGICAAALGALIVYAAAPWLGNDIIVPLYFICLALPFYSFTYMLDGLARSYNWINLALVPPFVLRPLLLISVVAGMHLAGFGLEAATVAGVLAAVTCFTALLQLYQFQRRINATVPAGPKRYDPRRWLSTSLPILLVWGMYTLLTSTDVLLLKQFRSPTEVAHYYAAAKTLALVSIIQFAVAAAAAHRFTAYHVAGDRTALASLAADTVRWVFWPSLAAVFALMAVGHYLLMMFGASFTAGYPFMAVLAVGLLARASIGPTERLLNMLGEQKLCAVAYAAAFVVNVAVALILAPAYGGIGVASATAAAFIVESVSLFLIARRRLGLTMFVGRRPV